MDENKKINQEPIVDENDFGVVEMRKALQAQQNFENSIDKGEFSLKDLTVMKKFLKYFKPFIGKFIFAILLDVIITFGFVFLPRIVGWIINDLTAEVPLSMDVITRHFTIYFSVGIGIVVVLIISMYFNGIIFYTIGQKIVKNIRNDLFEHVESLSLAQINALPVGKYITRITNDCRGLSMFFTDLIVNFVRDILNIVMTIIMAFTISWKLALILVGFVPIVFFISVWFRNKTKKYYREQRRQRSEINGFLSEAIYGISTIKMYDKEEDKNNEFRIKNERLKQSYIHQVNIHSFYRPVMYLLQMIGVAMTVFFGVVFVLNKDFVPFTTNRFAAGDLYNFYDYTTEYFHPIQEMAELMDNFQNIVTSAERVSALMGVKPSVENTQDAKDLIELEKENNPDFDGVNLVKGDIEFKNVWFAYIGEEWVLKDVSFHINAGQSVAFVGATGAGKSTIIGLLVRNIIPQKGDIYIDGINIKDITIESLRKNVSQMMQDVFLFSGTISDNIHLFNTSFDMDRVIKSCELVGADKFINNLENGYDTIVRERGNNFSVGQKQLISFARAVYHKPSIMVLDEATANIDTETEITIQNSLKSMRTLGTMVIVAHRLSTIKDCDCIYVVDKGVIVEEGTHNDLIKKEGVYYSMFKLQNLAKSFD